MPTLCKTLVALRAAVNAAAPNRDKASDGWVGDLAHQARKSDHNTNPVRALDITHDPAGGCDAYVLAETIRVSGDLRIDYIISDGKIAKPGGSWEPYTGPNPHTHHTHFSAAKQPILYDDPRPWNVGRIAGDGVKRPQPKPATGPFLMFGFKGDKVKELQRLLKVEPDGRFGLRTRTAVEAFQRKNGLVVDGKVGTYTWLKLKAA